MSKRPQRAALRQPLAVPAGFTGDDAVRAIRSGCKTVLEVERFVRLRRNDTKRKIREAAQRSKFAAKFVFGS